MARTIMLLTPPSSPYSDMHQRNAAALVPVTVDKPWGREIWYSGVEARGESGVRAPDATVPLSQYLAGHGRCEPITLLKALHPATGNLYLEVHEAKWEVYIVDRVDFALWPGGGWMLLGVDQQQRRALGNAGLRAALLKAAQGAEHGDTEVADVEAFLKRVPLRAGDVVTIPPGVPHSLRQGIDVIEFQDPVFERRILAASQPVVTQNGWDSAAAIAAMQVAAEADVTHANSPGELAATPRFRVVRFAGAAAFAVPPWTVGWVQCGELDVGGCRFSAGSAFLTSAHATLRASPGSVALAAVEAA